MITVSRVTKTYGTKSHKFRALNDVSFEVPDGASVAIVGKSGSGKSTLMHVMSGLDRPEKGEIVVDGENILKMDSRAIDRFRSIKMGFIFQAFFVQANETCYHNVGLPLEIAGVRGVERKRRIREALSEVDLLEKIHQPARNLSGGQKQRLAIARAIVGKPRLIFADEPTGNLDSATGMMVEEQLFDFNRRLGSTLIIVTHDDELAARCDMRVYIRDGQVERIDKLPMQKGKK